MRPVAVTSLLTFVLVSAAAQESSEVTESIHEGCIRQGLPPNCRVVPVIPIPMTTKPRMNMRNCGPLEYPGKSMRLGETGSVTVRVAVTREGVPSSVSIAKSSGSPRLDQASTSHVLTCRFEPARAGEVAIQSVAMVPYEWKLEPAEPGPSAVAR